MRDLKYIVKRIIIGVGIVLVLGFINSAKASALEITGYTGKVDKSAVTSSSVNRLLLKRYGIYFYQDTFSGDIIICNDDTKCSIIYVSQIPFDYNKIGVATWNTSSSATFNRLIFLTKDSDLPYLNGSTSFNSITTRSNTLVLSTSMSWSTMNNVTPRVFSLESNKNFTIPGMNPQSFSNYYFDSNTAWVYNCYNNNCKNSNSNIVIESISSIPKIESLQAHKNIQQGVLFSYQFSPKFSNFDTTNYKYQWKFGHDSSWNDFVENEQLLNFKNNGELYVRIVDKSNNSVIDNENFVIYGIGQLSSNSSIYDIIFTDNFNSYTEDHSIIVDEVKIDIEFIPDSDRLRYQYKFVPEGENASDIIWTTSATNKISYTTTVNGSIYARITDIDYNTSYEETHTIPNIGKIGLGQNNALKTNNFFQKISSQINYGGPISSLFKIPVDILQKIYSYSSSSCSPYKISSLLGTDIVLPCYNFREIFGNNIYTIIDSLLCFILSLCLFKFVRNIYNKFMNMDDISS